MPDAIEVHRPGRGPLRVPNAEQGEGRQSVPGAPDASGRLRITLLARSLGYGGAERQLVLLAKGLRARGRHVSVVLFYGGAPLEAELHEARVRVHVLEKRGRWDVVPFLARLRRVLREERPNVLHGYLDVPNMLATIMRLTGIGRPKVVWGLRASNVDLSHYDWLSTVVDRVGRGLCRFTDLIIANSRAGFEHAAHRGYPRRRMVVIPNGIDTERFSPDPAGRRRLRREWGVGPDEWVIGVVGRLDPMKDHPTFLAAAARLARRRSDVRFVCVGAGDAGYREELRALGRALGLDDRLLWLDARADVRSVYSALDVVCSSSAFGEGFSNVVAEAMACGRPCVVTDVGDSAWLLGQPAFTVPPRDPIAMADRVQAILDSDPASLERLRAEVRERVVANFSVPTLVERTERAMAELVGSVSR